MLLQLLRIGSIGITLMATTILEETMIIFRKVTIR